MPSATKGCMLRTSGAKFSIHILFPLRNPLQAFSKFAMDGVMRQAGTVAGGFAALPHILTFSHSHILTFSHSHILKFSHSHILTFSHSHVLTFSRSLGLSWASLISLPLSVVVRATQSTMWWQQPRFSPR